MNRFGPTASSLDTGTGRTDGRPDGEAGDGVGESPEPPVQAASATSRAVISGMVRRMADSVAGLGRSRVRDVGGRMAPVPQEVR